MSHDALIRGVERYYSAKVAEHGATPLGVDWNDEASQRLRFERLLEVVDDGAQSPSINDFGCGYGGLLDVLQGRFEDFSYRGYVVSQAMIQAAQQRHEGDAPASSPTEPSWSLPTSRSRAGSSTYGFRSRRTLGATTCCERSTISSP